MTTFSDEVRAIVSPHKFGGSRRAAAAYLVSLEGAADGETGDVSTWGVWVGRVGRTLVFEDSQGFVSAERFGREVDAMTRFEALERDYSAYADGEV